MWEKGRQLKSFGSNTYTYNANGIRTSKTVGGVKHTYELDGTKILREEFGGAVITPIYDNEDSVCGIMYGNVSYYFIKNLQGDVIAITDDKGEVVARYEYDAWGFCAVLEDTTNVGFGNLNLGIADANPYRYRSYYFDYETGLYYLQSRYYDPEIGRFINADDASMVPKSISNFIFFKNLYSYCYNNPEMYLDLTGYDAVILQYKNAAKKWDI